MNIGPEVAVEQVLVVGHVVRLVLVLTLFTCGNSNLLGSLELVHPYLGLGLVEVSGIAFLYPSGLCNQRVTEGGYDSLGQCLLCISDGIVHLEYTLLGESRSEQTVEYTACDRSRNPCPSIEFG